jgi:hypothetical protein
MRESGSLFVNGLGVKPGMKVLDLVAVTVRPHCRPRNWEPTCSASTSPATSSKKETFERRMRGSITFDFKKAMRAT